VVAGAARLRAHGYRLGVDEVGLHDHPLAVIAQIEPDLVKLHPEVTAGLLSDPGCDAVLDAVRRLCQHIGAELVVDGITDADRLRAVRRHGIGIGQGSLLAGPARRPPTQVVLPAAAGPAVVPRPRQPAEQPVPAATDGPDSSPSIGTFAQPAVTVPDTSTGDAVRDAFRSGPEVTSVVLVDDAHRPVGLLDRNRFMIAVSGQFGHALHARRPVRDLADPPRVLPATADPRAVLDLMGVGGPGRVYDDITVVDRDGRCTGVPRVGDLLRGIAELGYDRALALHPTTGLPGLPALPDLLDEQRTRGQGFALGVFACDVRPVVERGGFDAAVDGLRAVAAAVTAALGELPGSVAVHGVGDDIVVLTGLDLIADVESAVHRRLVDDRHAPQLRTTWLRCPPGHPVDPVQLARELSRRAAHLGHHG
jgi:EAL domain